MKKYLALILVVCLLALWPFFKKGYFESHDGQWMVIRFTAFHQQLRAGQFPVRFTDRLNNNYGYPVLNFLYPLPFYFAEIPKIIGFGFVSSIKIVFIVSTIFSAIGMFWATSQLFGKEEALAAAITYVFIPYRFVDLYVRGSIGENLAFTFLPLVLGSIIKIAKGNKQSFSTNKQSFSTNKIFVPILAFSISALILSHNVIAILFLPLFVLVSYLSATKQITRVIIGYLLGAAMSAFFWIPALYDLQFVRLSQIKVSNISDHLVSISKLLSPSWGYGPSPQDSLSVQIGIVPLFILLSAVVVFLKSNKKNPPIALFILVTLFSSFMMTKASLPIWKFVPFLDIIQFPWRLLALVVFSSSVLAAYVISQVSRRGLMASLVIIAGITGSALYTKPRNFVDRGDSYYATNEDSTTVQNEYLPLWVKSKPNERANQKIEIEKGKIISTNIIPGNYQAVVNSNQATTLTVNTIYFPGWIAKVDGKIVPIDYQNEQGLIAINLPEGEHKVIINYTHSSVHLASETISALAILATGVYFLKLWPKRNS